MAVEDTVRALRRAWSRDTSELPDRWTPDRPSTGHCSVASLIVRDRHAGHILTGLVAHAGGTDSHQWNVIDGLWVDTTGDQFDGVHAVLVDGYWQPTPGHLRYVRGLVDQLEAALDGAP